MENNPVQDEMTIAAIAAMQKQLAEEQADEQQRLAIKPARPKDQAVSDIERLNTLAELGNLGTQDDFDDWLLANKDLIEPLNLQIAVEKSAQRLRLPDDYWKTSTGAGPTAVSPGTPEQIKGRSEVVKQVIGAASPAATTPAATSPSGPKPTPAPVTSAVSSTQSKDRYLEGMGKFFDPEASARDRAKMYAEKYDTYAKRIVGGERPEDVLVGTKKGGVLWNEVMKRVQEANATAAVSSEAVSFEPPRPPFAPVAKAETREIVPPDATHPTPGQPAAAEQALVATQPAVPVSTEEVLESAPQPAETPPAATPPVAVLEPKAAAAEQALDINQQLQEDAESHFDALFEPTGKPGTPEAEQLAIDYEQQRVSTPEAIQFADAETEQSQPAIQKADDERQVHRRFLDTHAEVIESLRSTPSELWTPDQRSQAEQIRKTKEAYKNRILDLTQGPVQGPEAPEPPETARNAIASYGSERTIETPDLFATQRPAAQPQSFATPEGTTARQPAHLEALQAAAEAATPAEFVEPESPFSFFDGVSFTDVNPPLPESPPALAAIPEEYRGNLASDALSEAVQMEGAAINAPPVLEPEAPPVEAEVVPTSIWTRMGRRARQAFQSPPVPASAQHQPQLDPASFSEGTREHPRSVFDQSDEEQQEPLATGDSGYAGTGRRILDSLTGGRGGSRGGARGGSQGVMHVWVDGGQLQVVDHVNTIGAVTGQTVPVSSPSPATGPQGAEESAASDTGGLGDLDGLGGVAAAGFAIHQSIQGAASFAGHPEVAQVAGDATNTAATIGAAALVNPFLALGVAVAILPSKIMDWTNALIEGKRDIAAFSGQLQYVFGEKERREAIRGIQTADAVAPSTSLLSDQFQDLLDEVRPIKDVVTQDLQNLMLVMVEALRGAAFVAKIAQTVSEATNAMTSVRQIVREIADALADSNADTNFENWAKFARSGMGQLPTLRPLGL